MEVLNWENMTLTVFGKSSTHHPVTILKNRTSFESISWYLTEEINQWLAK